MGLRPALIRTLATAAGGAFAGVGGAYLSLFYPGSWNEGISSGQGLMAVALVIFARWNPIACFGAALLFGGAGALDVAIYEVEHPKQHEEVLFEDPTCWVASTQRDFQHAESLPVALFDHACWWRDVAIASLEARASPYRIAYSSQSVSGVIAAVEAGIAVGLLGRSSLHRGLAIAGKSLGFGSTPPSKLVMAANGSTDAEPQAAMKEAIRAAFLTTA